MEVQGIDQATIMLTTLDNGDIYIAGYTLRQAFSHSECQTIF